jgi:GTP-binding protein
MDATVAGYIQEAGRGVVIAVNKWDLAAAGAQAKRRFEEEVRDRLKFLSWAPIVFLSARSERGWARFWARRSAWRPPAGPA